MNKMKGIVLACFMFLCISLHSENSLSLSRLNCYTGTKTADIIIKFESSECVCGYQLKINYNNKDIKLYDIEYSSNIDNWLNLDNISDSSTIIAGIDFTLNGVSGDIDNFITLKFNVLTNEEAYIYIGIDNSSILANDLSNPVCFVFNDGSIVLKDKPALFGNNVNLFNIRNNIFRKMYGYYFNIKINIHESTGGK